MSEPFIGQIIMFSGNFPPRGWAFCDGQYLAIREHQDLFSIIGTTYGGDGRTTFALPDLRGRSPVHAGSGPGLSSISLGQRGGTEQHTHYLNATTEVGDSDDPTNRLLAKPTIEGEPVNAYFSGSDDNTTLSLSSISPSDGSSTEVRSPYTGIHFIIALQGVKPIRGSR